MNKKPHTYYCVTSKITDRGCSCVIAATVTSDKMPNKNHVHTARADYYSDWFYSEEDALEFIKKNKS